MDINSEIEKYRSKLKIRLVFAMMYSAFEVKNEMMQSVTMYQQLQ